MTLRKSGSRLLTVDGRRYRWIASETALYPGERLVIVEETEVKNGRQLVAAIATESVVPSLVRRLILEALDASWDPRERSTEPFCLSEEAMLRATRDYDRSIEVDGATYVWRTEGSSSGLHIVGRLVDDREGQTFATEATFDQRAIGPHLITALIRKALALGWQPAARGKDCFWLPVESLESGTEEEGTGS